MSSQFLHQRPQQNASTDSHRLFPQSLQNYHKPISSALLSRPSLLLLLALLVTLGVFFPYVQAPFSFLSLNSSSNLKWREYTLADAAARVAKENTLIVCAVSEAYLPFLNNWLISIARQRQQDKVLVIAEDYTTLYQVNERWPGHAVLVPPALETAAAHKFGSQMDTKLRMSSAYHPQTDDQIKVLNRYLEQYLRAFAADKPTMRSKFLVWAEYHYNTSHHSAIVMSLYQAVYGRHFPTMPMFNRGRTTLPAVEEVLSSRDEVLKMLRSNLIQARNRMKQMADRGRKEKQFQEGDWVLVKLQPNRKIYVGRKQCHKLNKRYYGSYQIVREVGDVTYTWQLPQTSRIQPTFHVSQLKEFKGEVRTTIPSLPEAMEANHHPYPKVILASQLHQHQGQTLKQVLVQWDDNQPEDATYEDFLKLCAKFEDLHLEDKVHFEEQGRVTPIVAARAKP